jgi:hypothetical protein
MIYKAFIKSNRHIMVAFDEAVWTVPIGDPYYEPVARFIEAKDYDELVALYQLAQCSEKPVSVKETSAEGKKEGKRVVISHVVEDKKATQRAQLDEDRIDTGEGMIRVNGQLMPAFLGKTILKLLSAKKPVSYLEIFWNHLKRNPSESSRQQLFRFLKQHHFTITDDGCFIAYKRVRDDFKDFHSGTFNNSPGATPSMRRENVVENPKIECAAGLHIAAFDYMPTYHGGQGKIVECKVNPYHVVSVPFECGGQKIRCCKYEVIREFKSGGLSDTVRKSEPAKPVTPVKTAKTVQRGRKLANVFGKTTPTPKAPVVKDASKAVELAIGTNRNRIRIHSKLLAAIGASAGETVYCEYTKEKIVLRKDKTPGAGAYTVNKDGGFKMSYDVVVASGLQNKRLMAEVVNGVILISGS